MGHHGTNKDMLMKDRFEKSFPNTGNADAGQAMQRLNSNFHQTRLCPCPADSDTDAATANRSKMTQVLLSH